jgi:hypothetical protein
LWPDATHHPGRHAALAAAQSVMTIAARKPRAGERWRVTLTREDLLEIVDCVLAELVEGAAWTVEKAGTVSPALPTVVEGLFDAVRRRADERLRSKTGVALVKLGLSAAATRAEFVVAVADRGPLVAAALDVVLAQAFGDDPTVLWRLAREEVLIVLTQAMFERLARAKLDPGALGLLETVLAAQVKTIEAGGAWSVDQFADELERALPAR